MHFDTGDDVHRNLSQAIAQIARGFLDANILRGTGGLRFLITVFQICIGAFAVYFGEAFAFAGIGYDNPAPALLI